MASYVENSLMQGERVLHGGQLHWILMVQPVGLVCLGLVGAVVGCFYPNLLGGFPAYGPGAIVALFGLFGILMAWIRRFSTELAVTDRRVVAKFGFIARRTYEISLRRVEGAHVEQGLLGRLFDFGTIIVKGTGGGVSPIPGLADPMAFRLAVAEAMERSDSRESVDDAAA